MLYGTSSVASDNQQLLSGLGLMLLVVGGLMFGLGVLVELFSIRPALRQLASLHTRMGDPDSTQAAPPCAKAGGAAKSD
jgi:predicted lipid-binding transport protein (Tim44 family)